MTCKEELEKQASDYEMKLAVLRGRWHESDDKLAKVLIEQAKRIEELGG